MGSGELMVLVDAEGTHLVDTAYLYERDWEE